MNELFRAQSPADLIELVRSQPLAWIVSGDDQDRMATVLPVQLECDSQGNPLRLLGHFGRSNPHWRALATSPRAMVLLIGPHAYISPSWFADRTQAPTWNYASAAFEVVVEIRDTPADADRLLCGLVADMEQDRPAAWSAQDMGERYAKLSLGVVGFQARILDAKARFKLGQDERDDVFADILNGLDIGNQPLADWMRRFAAPRNIPLFEALPPPAPLDADIMRFIDDVRERSAELTAGRILDWPERRKIAERSRLPWQKGVPTIASVQEVNADTEVGPVRLRIYHPTPGQIKPALIYMHGGGWALFSLDTHDRLMREYAARSGMVVVGVDYALAPEARYPIALNQVVGVVRWLRAHGNTLGLDADQLILGGDSAGGNLSMGAVLKLRDAGEGDAIKAVLSNYGGFSRDCSPASRQRYGTPNDMLTSAEVDEFWNNYAGHINDRRDPYAAPVLANLHGLPPVFLVVGECDVLTEQNLLMAGCLLEAGVQVKIKMYPGAPHSFIEAMSVSALASQAIDDGVAWLQEILPLASGGEAELPMQRVRA